MEADTPELLVADLECVSGWSPSCEVNSHWLVQFLQCVDNAVQNVFSEESMVVEYELAEEVGVGFYVNFRNRVVFENFCVAQVW